MKHVCAGSAPTLAIGLAVALAVALPGCADDAPRRPRREQDVILIVIDTLRADHVGCFGYDRPTTPTIDSLAAQGVRVADVTAQSSWTGPSMVSMFVSRHLAADFVRMPPETTLAERLAAEGWRTAGFQDNILLAPGTGYDRGFEVYELEPGPQHILPVLNSKDPRPLFAYFHFVGPHDPWDPVREYDVFESRPLDPTWRRAHGDYLRTRDPGADEAEIQAGLDTAWAKMSRDIALYDGDILQCDAKVDYVLGALHRAGRLDDALIVIASDHGEGLWQHRISGLELEADPPRGESLLTAFKRTHNALVYEELTRVPLIFSGPGVPQGVVLSGLAENVDIAPTILDLLGLPGLDGADGRSLVPAMEAAARGEPLPGREVVLSNTNQFSSARTRDGRKLILPANRDGPDPAAVYDLSQDPDERRPEPAGETSRGSSPAWPELLRAVELLRSEGLRPQANEGDLDPLTLERMRQLGYVGETDESEL